MLFLLFLGGGGRGGPAEEALRAACIAFAFCCKVDGLVIRQRQNAAASGTLLDDPTSPPTNTPWLQGCCVCFVLGQPAAAAARGRAQPVCHTQPHPAPRGRQGLPPPVAGPPRLLICLRRGAAAPALGPGGLDGGQLPSVSSPTSSLLACLPASIPKHAALSFSGRNTWRQSCLCCCLGAGRGRRVPGGSVGGLRLPRGRHQERRGRCGSHGCASAGWRRGQACAWRVVPAPAPQPARSKHPPSSRPAHRLPPRLPRHWPGVVMCMRPACLPLLFG
jgi:hypothetical protein